MIAKEIRRLLIVIGAHEMKNMITIIIKILIIYFRLKNLKIS